MLFHDAPVNIVFKLLICVWADDVTSKYEALLKVFCFVANVVFIVFNCVCAEEVTSR